MMQGFRRSQRNRTAGAVRRRVCSLLLVLALALAATPAAAAELYDRAELDRLFVLLQGAPDAETAADVSQRIWRVWTAPNDPVLAERWQTILLLRLALDLRGAIGLLDGLLLDYPDFSEGWNQRATLHYLLGEDDASLADIEKVLEFEPRHFGALSGRAMIHLRQGRRDAALRDMATAVRVYPFLPSRALFPELPAPATRI